MSDMTPEQVADALKLADFALNSEGSTQREIELARLARHLAEKLEKAERSRNEWRKDFGTCAKAREQAEAREDALVREIQALRDDSEQAEARLAKAREALRKYGRHQSGCPARRVNELKISAGEEIPGPCACGLDAAIKGEP